MTREKLELKYSFNCHPRDLFLAFTQPSYLQNWMADQVKFDEPEHTYTFRWDTYIEKAKVLEMEQDRLVKWTWLGDGRNKNEYLSFVIHTYLEDDIIDLHITDFCDPGESRQLRSEWDENMEELERLL